MSICEPWLRPRTHGNVFLRFCIVSSNELVVLDSLENSKQYKNAGKRFRVGPKMAIETDIKINELFKSNCNIFIDKAFFFEVGRA